MHLWTHSPIQKKSRDHEFYDRVMSEISDRGRCFTVCLQVCLQVCCRVSCFLARSFKISFELAPFEEFATAVLQTVTKRDGCHHVITFLKSRLKTNSV